MDKFNRFYQLTIGTPFTGRFLQVSLPFTCEFQIERNTLSSVNNAVIRIYNLNEANRNLIRKDEWNTLTRRSVELTVGYGDKSGRVTNGTIRKAWSTREGSNLVTTIDSFDGGWAFVHSFINKNYPKGTPKQHVIEDLALDLTRYGVSLGRIGKFEGTLKRGNSFSGNTAQIINDITSNKMFIDNGKINILHNNEYIDTNHIIDSSTGLLGTPLRELEFIYFDMLFEPSINIGEKVEIVSTTDPSVNGIYKIYSIIHTGTVSEAVGGMMRTRAGVLRGQFFAV